MCSGRYSSLIADFRYSVDEIERRTHCKVIRSEVIRWSLASKECRFTVNIA